MGRYYIVQILYQTPCPSFDESLSFYTRLGFKVISKESPCIVSDGKVFIEINPKNSARAGIKFYKPCWKEEIEKLKQITSVRNTNEGALFADHSGIWIYLIEGELDIDVTPEEECYSRLGGNAGLSFETIDTASAAEIYEILGFSRSYGEHGGGCVTYREVNGTEISLMSPNGCPHLCFNPSFNYFNGEKNLSVIEGIREAGISITQEITHFNRHGIVDNVIIRDPGGFGFFVFSD